MSPEKNHPDYNKDQTQEKYKNGNAIDPMHIAHPFAMRRIRISFFDIQVFCQLSPYSHKNHLRFKDIKQ